MNNNFIITAPGFGPLTINAAIPPALYDHVIPGSTVFSAETAFGSFLLQLFNIEGFSWVYSVFDIQKDVALYIASPATLLISHIALSGNSEHSIKGFSGDVAFTENEFRIFSFPGLSSTTFLRKNRRYAAIDVCYPVEYMLRTLPLFPVFDAFAGDIVQAKASFIPLPQVYANALMVEQLHHLVHSPFSSTVKSFHLNILRNLLTLMLTEASATMPRRNPLRMQQLEIVYAAKEFIDAHLSEHFTILEIAKKVGINTQDLKKGFKNIFGTGLFEYLLTERLTIARINLEETFKPVKDIARKAGYKSPGNFSTAFKKKFGKSPLAWRQHYKIEKNHSL